MQSLLLPEGLRNEPDQKSFDGRKVPNAMQVGAWKLSRISNDVSVGIAENLTEFEVGKNRSDPRMIRRVREHL